jgi:hypothetical protein
MMSSRSLVHLPLSGSESHGYFNVKVVVGVVVTLLENVI